jgi:serine/threonine protein phosphatase 1
VNRLIAIGDIHGEITKLRQLMEKIKPSAGDRLVFLGDYIDRGEDSFAVIEYLIDFKARFPKTVFLMGNHEAMFMTAHDTDDRDDWSLWLGSGGRATVKNYNTRGGEFPDSHGHFYGALKVVHRVGRFVFVHAGFETHKSVEKQLEPPCPSATIWGRDHLKSRLLKWSDDLTVVCGHTPQGVPVIGPKLICIDTGACFGWRGYGTLTAIDVNSRKLFQVSEVVTA